MELYTTTFETMERKIREQLARTLGPGGFDPARDIAAITVNRWPHGYAYEYNSLWDPFWLEGGETPCEVARKPLGRIAIANADAGAYAYTDEAINQAWRAVGETHEEISFFLGGTVPADVSALWLLACERVDLFCRVRIGAPNPLGLISLGVRNLFVLATRRSYPQATKPNGLVVTLRLALGGGGGGRSSRAGSDGGGEGRIKRAENQSADQPAYVAGVVDAA